jgi:O-antigen ligase
MLISGGLKRMTSSIGIVVGCYTFWMLSCTPFSTWKGGSANYVLWYVAFWVVLMLIIGHAPRTPRDIVRLAGVVVFSCLFFLIGGSHDQFGRLAVVGTFGNSDDVALMAGFAIPFALLIGFQFKNTVVRYLFLVSTVGYLLLTTGRTGTRAAILAMAGLLAVYFFRSKASHKMAILAVSVVAVIGLLFTLPDNVLDRLATIVDSLDEPSGPAEQRTEAAASTAERRDLLMDAIQMTKDNPIFGVGPGEFPDYRYNFLRDALGRPKRFFPSHNTYAQISAESGIPGLLLYLTFLFATYRTILRFRKLTRQTDHPESALLQRIALCLEASLVYFAICAIFMTCDRHPHQFVIAGMAIAGERLLAFWTSQRAAAPPLQPDPLGARKFAPAERFPNMLPARPAF